MPYFSGDQLSISCLKYMEVVNMNVLFCYLVTVFLISFCLALFYYNLPFLMTSEFLVLKAINFVFLLVSKSLLQFSSILLVYICFLLRRLVALFKVVYRASPSLGSNVKQI